MSRFRQLHVWVFWHCFFLNLAKWQSLVLGKILRKLVLKLACCRNWLGGFANNVLSLFLRLRVDRNFRVVRINKFCIISVLFVYFWNILVHLSDGWAASNYSKTTGSCLCCFNWTLGWQHSFEVLTTGDVLDVVALVSEGLLIVDAALLSFRDPAARDTWCWPFAVG